MHFHWWRHLGSLYSLFHSFLPLLIGGGGVAGVQKLRQRRAAGWPSADGEVQHANVEKKNGYVVTLEYRYYARSQYHNGKYTRHFRRKQQAEQFADALHGRHIQVRYREDKPEISVVLEHDLRTTGVLQVS